MENSNKPKRILFIMHMPPPVHGAAMMGKYIKDSEEINNTFDCRYVNLSTGAMGDTGAVSFHKLRTVWRIYTQSIKNALLFKPNVVYFTPCAKGPSFCTKEFHLVQILKFLGCKIVVHLHNKGVSEVQDKWYYNWLFKRFYKGVKVILLSELLYTDVKKYVKREDVFICPNGIPEIKNYVYQPHHNEIPHILFLSNLLIGKGVIVLLDALKILKDKGYSFVCDFVGSETHEIDAQRFQKEVDERGLNQMVIYQGKKYGNEKETCFEQADIFAFPTFYGNETFGLVNLEAMAHHIPVVSTNEGGIPDVVRDGENGLICKKNDSESLAACLLRLLDDEALRNKLGEKGYSIFKKEYTQKVLGENMTSILEGIEWGGVKITLCRYFGKKYDEDKEAFFENADLFVFPTFYSNECFPLVLLEAMQHGLPCISTNEGGIPDIVKHDESGFICNKKAPQSLAKSIELLLNSPERMKRYGVNGRKRYDNHFSIECFEKRMCNILKIVCNN